MRLPRRKIWRAFRELDGFSDQQCRMFVDRAAREYAAGRVVAIGVAIAGSILAGPILYMGAWAALTLIDDQWRFSGLVMPLVALFLVFCACMAVLIARDRWLIRTITRRIHHASCAGCGYSMLGLTPTDGIVMCPECNQPFDLRAAGMTPEDLLARNA
jgi:hypothetical protein